MQADPRTPDLRFDAERQAYSLSSRPDLVFRRCSEFVGSFFEPFDGPAIAQNLVANHSRYKDRTVEELLAEWDSAAVEGTRAHAEVQDWILAGTEPTSPKALGAVRWLAENYPSAAYHLEPEVPICDPDLRLAGTSDLLARPHHSERWTLIDWKTNKKIEMSPYKDKRGVRGPARAWPDCSYFKYTLQLSLYRYLLESRRGLRFEHQMIVHLTEGGAVVLDCPYHRGHVDLMLDCDMPRPDPFAFL